MKRSSTWVFNQYEIQLSEVLIVEIKSAKCILFSHAGTTFKVVECVAESFQMKSVELFDVTKMLNTFGQPSVSLEEGVDRFVNWSRQNPAPT